MTLKTFFVAALAAMTLASCSKDDTEGGGDTQTGSGKDAKLNIAFTLPQTGTGSLTRADQQATVEESAVTTVDVFIYKGGNLVSGTGQTGHVTLDVSKFDKVDDTYTLKTENNITTVSGDVSIYIALNLPGKYSTTTAYYQTKGALIQAHAALNEMITTDAISELKALDGTPIAKGTGGIGFTMFSDEQTETLTEVGADLVNPEINTVTVNIGRVVAKVVASTDEKVYEESWGTGADAIKFAYSIEQFNIYNEAIKTYLVPNTNTLVNTNVSDVINPYDKSVLKVNRDVTVGHPGTQALRMGMPGYYIGENTPRPVSLKGNTSHAFIATTLTLNKAAKWDDTNKEVVYDDVTYGGGSSNIIITIHEGTTYVTNDYTKAEAIGRNLKTLYPGTEADIYTYTDGWVHLRVWLRKEGKNDYRVGRNEFIHLMINGINLVDGVFPGNPGNPLDPTKPIDPTDPDNPDPIDPTDPVDPDDALLNVVINVLDWLYQGDDVILNE